MNVSAIMDRPVWQRYANSAWQSVGVESCEIEILFRSSSADGSLTIGPLTLDFNLMIDVSSNDPIRRLSSKETPDVIYEWEEIFRAGNSHWSSYSTDECEIIEISQKAGRKKTTLYIGSSNVPSEINFDAKTQLNTLTQHMRWMRKAPPLFFAASPSAIAPTITTLQTQVI